MHFGQFQDEDKTNILVSLRIFFSKLNSKAISFFGQSHGSTFRVLTVRSRSAVMMSESGPSAALAGSASLPVRLPARLHGNGDQSSSGALRNRLRTASNNAVLQLGVCKSEFAARANHRQHKLNAVQQGTRTQHSVHI